MALEEGATLIRVQGLKDGKSVCLDNYINAPGLTESFEKYGITPYHRKSFKLLPDQLSLF